MSSSIVTVKMNGQKELVDVKISIDEIEKDDVELLQDMIMVAVNNAFKELAKMKEQKLGKYTGGLGGLF